MQKLARTRAFFETIGALVAVAGAVNANQRPTNRALRGAGIDPAAFDAIRR